MNWETWNRYYTDYMDAATDAGMRQREADAWAAEMADEETNHWRQGQGEELSES